MTFLRGVCEHTEGRHLTVHAVNRDAGLKRVFEGRFVGEIPPFTVLGAHIDADDPDELRGARRFTGTVGPTRLALVFDNATQISGTLVPALEREWAVAGEGYWRAVF
ncbi:hypothetical protein ACFYTQ_31920 [Nocardia sp. NPDC004068]|uniref:hypothetical protein n=1 Tax=Nocardia sp. NPDC004068 TaxID=3364303 RepID=UPI0036C4582A